MPNDVDTLKIRLGKNTYTSREICSILSKTSVPKLILTGTFDKIDYGSLFKLLERKGLSSLCICTFCKFDKGKIIGHITKSNIILDELIISSSDPKCTVNTYCDTELNLLLAVRRCSSASSF